MNSRLCVKCGNNPRWYGPKGQNFNLTMCESCQRQSWRDAKAAKRKASGALLEDGTQRKSGRPRGDAPKPITDKVQEALNSEFPKTIKVVVVNRELDVAQLIEVPVISDVRFSEIRRPDDLLRLLRGSGHVVIYTERNKV